MVCIPSSLLLATIPGTCHSSGCAKSCAGNISPMVNAKSSSSSLPTLAVCVTGIYASFLSWSYLQEKIASKNYSSLGNAYFKSPLIINTIQAFFAMIVGTAYLSFKSHRVNTPVQFLFTNRSVFHNFVLIALTQAVSSPIAYQSLNHLDYLFYLLAKSCKLIPVMLVHRVIYRSTYPMYKYLVALCITAGVVLFSLSNQSKSTSNDGQILLGFGYLFVSLLLDGLTNSTQDQLLSKEGPVKITGAHLMSGLNLLNMVFTFAYMSLFTTQLDYFRAFVSQNGWEVVQDIVLFGLFGSLGQIFIFLTLEKFGSLLLVTVTVTRKMFSMCLSVFLFGHQLNFGQWTGLAVVFVGIFLESFYKKLAKPKKD
ncbi:hypothetical protein OGAPHI_000621 [Ogataea philodendri]|uniref:UDP-galactose transporter homolog 1 n=1 Tax=Ogataea philodendri TaxID=1378263 RepID=A0A9P8TA27_9ASCO|nr:uncharacterized protein OGAPHI_000621 [Ogataea philodendri]KAH3670910.1 hypothetical protein OGAPHI_000621 [Ogataea philodendri]